MEVYGLWHGGYNYSHSDPDQDAERFPSLAAAIRAHQERYDSNGLRRVGFYFANREAECVFTPGVGLESTMQVWIGEPGDYPDRVIGFGPRGGVRVESC